jgi:hypothetical protein
MQRIEPHTPLHSEASQIVFSYPPPPEELASSISLLQLSTKTVNLVSRIKAVNGLGKTVEQLTVLDALDALNATREKLLTYGWGPGRDAELKQAIVSIGINPDQQYDEELIQSMREEIANLGPKGQRIAIEQVPYLAKPLIDIDVAAMPFTRLACKLPAYLDKLFPEREYDGRDRIVLEVVRLSRQQLHNGRGVTESPLCSSINMTTASREFVGGGYNPILKIKVASSIANLLKPYNLDLGLAVPESIERAVIGYVREFGLNYHFLFDRPNERRLIQAAVYLTRTSNGLTKNAIVNNKKWEFQESINEESFDRMVTELQKRGLLIYGGRTLSKGSSGCYLPSRKFCLELKEVASLRELLNICSLQHVNALLNKVI